MRYEVVPHRSIGPLSLGMDREAVEELFGPPIQRERAAWNWPPGNPFFAEFLDDRTWSVGADTYAIDSFVLNGIELTGDFGEVQERLRSAGYRVVRGTPLEPHNEDIRLLPALDLMIVSVEGGYVDGVTVFGLDVWDTIGRPSEEGGRCNWEPRSRGRRAS